MQKTIYANGSAEVLIPAGQKIAIATYGNEYATISFKRGNNLEFVQRLDNDQVVLGSYADNRTVVISAASDAVFYSVAEAPFITDGRSVQLSDNLIPLALDGFPLSTKIDPLAKARADFQRAYRPGISKNVVFGDSYGAGAGAATYADSWAGRIQTKLAGRLDQLNGALGSQTVGAYIQPSIQQRDGLSDDIYMGIVGLNSIRRFPTADQVRDSKGATAAVLSWFAIPDKYKVRNRRRVDGAANPAVTYTGTWTFTEATNPLQYLRSYTTTLNATATYTITGTTMYFWYARNSTDTGRFSITIDGVDVGSFGTGNLSYDQPVGGWEPAVARVGGLSEGSHTVVIKLWNAGTLNALAVAGFDAETIESAVVLAGTMSSLGPLGWAVGAGTSENLNDPGSLTAPDAWAYGNGGAERFNAATLDAIRDLQADGLNVLPVNTDMNWAIATHITADNIHPSGSGHGKLSLDFLRQLNFIVPKV